MDHPGGPDHSPWGPPALVETHSALIILYGDQAHKVRKPLDLGFLDNSTVEARAEQSRREVELNSRLAPDVYTGVLEVRGPDGEVIDHVVRMRRLPGHQSLAALVACRAGRTPASRHPDLAAGVREVARQVTGLHSMSPRSAEVDAVGHPSAVAGLWEESLEHLRRLRVGQRAHDAVEHIGTLAADYLLGRTALLEERIAAGRIVDGHGDLLAADVYLTEDGPRVIDCLEFDDRLRYGDAVLDVAFLAMDLDRLGARDLAVVFLRSYRDASGDDAPSSLAHHYIAYRALVRAKVTAIRAEQAADGGGTDAVRATELLSSAVDSLLRGRVRLVLVGGVSGSGKSTLAQPLAGALGAELVRSDVVRGEVLAGDDRYSPEAIGRVYAEMLDRASELLARGRSVVLDATWLEPRRRVEAQTVAVDEHSELVEISCTAPRDELVRRIAERARAGTDPSEATAEVLDAQVADLVPWPEAIEVDTARLDVRDADAVQRWAERELGPLPWAWPHP